MKNGEIHALKRIGIASILLMSAALHFFRLEQEGFANLYYAAGVKSMLMNWYNFFFVSFDPGGFITIDKPPVGFWLQTLSAKVFGFQGWSLILPRESSCPNLATSGRCRVYPDRPQVCRRPQIFPYMVEPMELHGQSILRLRQTLLAVVDCPYVRLLQDEIAAYAAACELEMIFRHNKA